MTGLPRGSANDNIFNAYVADIGLHV